MREECKWDDLLQFAGSSWGKRVLLCVYVYLKKTNKQNKMHRHISGKNINCNG